MYIDPNAIAPNGFEKFPNWLFLNRPSWACPQLSAFISDLDVLTSCPCGMFFIFSLSVKLSIVI
jgi:hypothetical protein